MEISTQVNLSDEFTGTVGRVVELERRGLDVVWLSEAYGFDSPTLAGYLAAKTSSVKIGFAILSIYSRTPALIAQTAAGLDKVSGGRALLGLGASGPQVVEGWHGVEYDKPVGRTREVIEICRSVWSREQLRNDGIYKVPLPAGTGTGLGKPLKIMSPPLRKDIPIFCASLGVKNVEMTFSSADGWLPIFFVPEKADDVWGEAMRAGLEARPSQLSSPQIVAGGPLAIGDDVEKLRDYGRGMLALYIGGMGAKGKNFYYDLAVRYGYEREAKLIQNAFMSGDKQRAMAEVPAELLRDTSLIGSAGYVADRVRRYRDVGVTMLSVNPVGDDPLGSFEKLVSMVNK